MYNTPVEKWSNPARFANLVTKLTRPLWCYHAISYKLTKAESLELELDLGHFSLFIMYYLLFDWNNFGESLNIHLSGIDHII